MAKRHDVVRMKESGLRKSMRRRIQLSAADMHAHLNLENKIADKNDFFHHRPLHDNMKKAGLFDSTL